MRQQKDHLLAGGLSLFIPGAGLAYVGRWGWAAVNVIVALIVMLYFGVQWGHPILVWIVLGLASGSLADEQAKKHNEKTLHDEVARVSAGSANSSPDPSSPPAVAMKFCPSCGTRNEGSPYCPRCGTPLQTKAV
jgi:hypothetical protein